MPTHYFTLQRLVEELQLLKQAVIEEAFTFRRDECIVWFRLPSGAERGLVCSVHPQYASVTLLPPYWRKPKQRVSLFPEMTAAEVQQVDLLPNTRIVRLVVHRGEELLFSMVGGAKNNVILRNAEGEVTDVFKQEREASRSVIQQAWQMTPWEEASEDAPVVQALARAQWRLGNLYAREVLWRLRIDPKLPLKMLTTAQREAIAGKAQQLVEYLRTASTVFLYRIPGKLLPVLALLPLEQSAELIATVEGIAAGIWKWRQLAEEWELVRAFVRTVQRQLAQRLKKQRRTLSNLSVAMLQERMEQYQRYGDLLMMQPNLRQKGMRQITVEDWQGQQWHIPLEPSKTVLENAQRYYQKRKAIREKIQVFEAKRCRIQEEVQRLEAQQQQLEQIQTRRDIQRFLQRYPQWRALAEESKDERSETALFRIFHLGKWGIVAVGKDARSNDYLTTRWAKPNDYWFHVRNATGAHVVFRPAGNPPSQILEAVAAIAAYYSAERTAALVPVVCTLRKYLRKGKRMPTGSVVVERELRTILTPPRPPDEVLAALGE